MDRKRRSNCAAPRAVLISPTFVSYFVYHRCLSRYHRAIPNLSLTECRKIANAAVTARASRRFQRFSKLQAAQSEEHREEHLRVWHNDLMQNS